MHLNILSKSLTALVCLIGFAVPGIVSAETTQRYVSSGKDERPKPIVAVDNVCAWPNLTVLRDGTIVACGFNKPRHGGVPGDIECWASSDQGRTWEERGVAAKRTSPDSNRVHCAVGLAHNGDLVVLSTGFKVVSDVKAGFLPPLLPPIVCRSSDGGRTWKVDEKAFPPKAPNGAVPIPFGDITEGRDGTLRAMFYTDKDGLTDVHDNRVFMYRSHDDGRTWRDPVPIDANAYRNEGVALHLGDGKWLAAIRGGGLHLHKSADDGKTWNYSGRLTQERQHPGHLLRLRDGRLLLSYGNRTGTRGVDVRFSEDEGETWTAPFRVVDFEGDGGYPSSVQLLDGQVLTAYYAQKIESHDRYHMGVVVWDPEASVTVKAPLRE